MAPQHTTASRQNVRTAIENSMQDRSKIDENRREIDQKSIPGHFGRPRPFQGRVRTRLGLVRTRPGQLLDAHRPPQGRSWGVLDGPGASRRRSKTTPGRPADALRPPRSTVQACLEHRAPSNALAERFFDVFVSSRENTDVRFASVLMVFRGHRTK